MRAMLTPIVALAITIFLVQVARRVAPAVGLIDSPCARKSHEGEIPLVGGIAIGTAFTLFVIPSVYMLLARDHSKDRDAAGSQLAGVRP